MSELQQLLDNNQRWAESKMADKASYFEEMAIGQQPPYLYIGCADSRVPANEILGLDAGEVFVHRNIANLIPNTDLSVMATINYAVRHLKVKDIIVCGHYGCGGVKAAMQARDLGILNPWLREIRDVYRLYKDELRAIEDEDARYNRLVELNVIEQCVSVIKTASVQLSYAANGSPNVHGMVFDIKTGRLKDLEVDLPSILAGVQEIYNLTDTPLFDS